MATDFWSSSHYKRWIVDRATLRQARSDDLQYVDNPEHLAFLNIFTANLISRLAKKLSLRQRVVATATVFFRRFYVKNSYCETDPFIVAAACCYVAAKAEESPVHIKNVVSEARALFSEYGIKTFPSDNSKLAEMEFYLVDELECDLTVFHPYRTLTTLVGKGAQPASQAEAGEAEDGPRYWGTGEGKLELTEPAIQTAWFIINDAYRSELCLLYPPHLIAIAAIYLTLVFNTNTRAALQASTSAAAAQHSQSDPARRSSRSSSSSSKKQTQPPDLIGWMAGLNVSMSLVATIAQEMIALYALWDRYHEDAGPEQAKAVAAMMRGAPPLRGARAAKGSSTRSGSVHSGGMGSNAETPESKDDGTPSEVVTPMFLVQLLLRMREARMADLAHPASGRPVAINKMLERTQAAG
ncbi:cyclin-like protein, partial [Cubamyces sp. BRFM 1775]